MSLILSGKRRYLVTFCSKPLSKRYFRVHCIFQHNIKQRHKVFARGSVENYHISSLIRRCFFSFQNNPKNLDPSYQTDLNLWDCLMRVKPVLQQNCIGLI